jgi:N-acetylneuraminate synthase/N,N'-diacetyllegionaminate synthase
VNALRRLIGEARPWVVAEIGVNHNGRLAEALALVELAARAGAQAVKFQAFRAERLARVDAPLAEYQRRNLGGDGGQREMLRALEIDTPALTACAARARELGLAFGVTPFDPRSLAEILPLEPDFVKIGSGDADNFLLLEAARACGRPVIVSTGMCDGDDVERLLDWFAGARERLALLHCVSAYPAPAEDCNLLALAALRREGVVTGFSDHTADARAACLALALGAEIIERHITLDRAAPGPDHACSSDEADLRAWLAALAGTRALLGDGMKRPMPSEGDTRRVARKSLVLARPLRAGEALERGHAACLRPADGLPAWRLPGLLGRRAARDLEAGLLLNESDLREEGP